MTELPSLPLFVTDYLGDTYHLTLEEHGAYTLLMMLCWRSPGCSIPDDSEWIQRRMQVSENQIKMCVRPIVNEFFARKNGRIFQKRLSREYDRALAYKTAKTKAGKKGGVAKALKTNSSTPDTPTNSPQANDMANDMAKRNFATDEILATNTNTNTIREREDKPVLTSESARAQKEDFQDREWPKPGRMSEGFSLPDSGAEFAKSMGIIAEDVALEEIKFRSHYLAATGPNCRSADWSATWTKWICREVDNRRQRVPVGATADDVHEQRRRTTARLKAEGEREYEQDQAARAARRATKRGAAGA